jgi:hypothetical protein
MSGMNPNTTYVRVVKKGSYHEKHNDPWKEGQFYPNTNRLKVKSYPRNRPWRPIEL